MDLFRSIHCQPDSYPIWLIHLTVLLAIKNANFLALYKIKELHSLFKNSVSHFSKKKRTPYHIPMKYLLRTPSRREINSYLNRAHLFPFSRSFLFWLLGRDANDCDRLCLLPAASKIEEGPTEGWDQRWEVTLYLSWRAKWKTKRFRWLLKRMSGRATLPPPWPETRSLSKCPSDHGMISGPDRLSAGCPLRSPVESFEVPVALLKPLISLLDDWLSKGWTCLLSALVVFCLIARLSLYCMYTGNNKKDSL